MVITSFASNFSTLVYHARNGLQSFFQFYNFLSCFFSFCSNQVQKTPPLPFRSPFRLYSPSGFCAPPLLSPSCFSSRQLCFAPVRPVRHLFRPFPVRILPLSCCSFPPRLLSILSSCPASALSLTPHTMGHFSSSLYFSSRAGLWVQQFQQGFFLITIGFSEPLTQRVVFVIQKAAGMDFHPYQRYMPFVTPRPEIGCGEPAAADGRARQGERLVKTRKRN